MRNFGTNPSDLFGLSENRFQGRTPQRRPYRLRAAAVIFHSAPRHCEERSDVAIRDSLKIIKSRRDLYRHSSLHSPLSTLLTQT